MLILFLIFPPLIATLLIYFIKKSLNLSETLSFLSSFIQFAVSFLIAFEVVQKGSYSMSPYFEVDALGALLLTVTSSVGLAAISYNIGYIRQEINKNIINFAKGKQTYILINFFLMAMFLAIASTNPVITWISIEATTLSTVFLISFYNKPRSIEAAWKYLVINSLGLMLAFLGTIIFMVPVLPMLGHELLTWENITVLAEFLDPNLVKIAFVFIFVGYGTKLGFAPMHIWKPDTYTKAPIPATALLAGALMNVGLLPLLRFKVITDAAVGAYFTQGLFIFFGLLSVFIASFAIFKQENYKRMFAYSSVEHIGIILLGFGFGGLGIYAALLHMVYHSLAKSAVFLLLGNLFLKFSSPKIKNVTGLIHTLPITGALLTIGFLALVGLPPFGIFFTEFYIILAGMKSNPLIATVLIFLLGLIFFGLFRLINNMMFGETPKDIQKGEFSNWTYIPPLILLATLGVLSIFTPGYLQILLNNAAKLFSGG